MRIFFILLVFHFVATPGLSQQPAEKNIKKPVPGQVPVKDQMRGQIAEAMNGLNTQIADLEIQLADARKNKADEETINGLQDQISMLKKQVKMMGGVTQTISSVPDSRIQQALDDDNNTDVPRKDLARIRMLPDGILTDAQLAPFLKNVHSEIERLMKAGDRTEAIELYNALKLKKLDSDDIGSVASTLWLSGQTGMALFILGRECNANRENLNNLNNYAAFLTMQGAQHAALPILQNLNAKVPNNSTILNNIGQAWFGLGDMDNASLSLNKAMGIRKNHPHANETNSAIEQSQGKTSESIESLKRSLEEDYTVEKESALDEKGYRVKFEDVKFKYPVKADQLGIEKFMFIIPEYPFEGGLKAQVSMYEWQDFRDKVRATMEALQQLKAEQNIKVKAYQQQVVDDPQKLKPFNNKVYKTANRKLTLLAEWGGERMQALNEEYMQAGESVEIWRREYSEAFKNTDNCGGRKALATTFLTKSNLLWQQKNAKMMSLQKQLLNAAANYSLYAYTDRSAYELAITDLKIKFLVFLAGMRCEQEVGCLPTDAPEGRQRGPLPDFDEENCQYKTELSIPYLEKFYSIKVECNKMTTSFDAKFVKGRFEENLANGKYKGTLEIEGKIGSDKINVGPVETGVSVKAGAGVDFTESGIQDVYVTSQAQVKAGALTVSSVGAKVSVVTGSTSLSGKGAFSGVNIRL